MIKLSVKQIDQALSLVENGLNKYTEIQGSVKNIDVSNNREFQKRFNHFYRVRRNSQWQAQFFKLLQNRKKKGITFKLALSNLYKKTGRLEASFISKLVATIDPKIPVIDKFVLLNAGLKLPYSGAKNRETRINTVYIQLQKAFKEFLKTENGKYLVKEFRKKFPRAKITKMKMADFVLWQTR